MMRRGIGLGLGIWFEWGGRRSTHNIWTWTFANRDGLLFWDGHRRFCISICIGTAAVVRLSDSQERSDFEFLESGLWHWFPSLNSSALVVVVSCLVCLVISPSVRHSVLRPHAYIAVVIVVVARPSSIYHPCRLTLSHYC